MRGIMATRAMDDYLHDARRKAGGKDDDYPVCGDSGYAYNADGDDDDGDPADADDADDAADANDADEDEKGASSSTCSSVPRVISKASDNVSKIIRRISSASVS